MSQEKKKEIPAGVQKYTGPIYEDTDENGIDAVLRKELEDQGLEWRFIDLKKAKANGGRSRSGWMIYKRQSEDQRLQGIKSLADPDGMVLNGTTVLAVKTTAGAQRQRDRRDAQNKTLTRYTENVTKQLGDQARTQLGGSKIIAGYDKNS